MKLSEFQFFTDENIDPLLTNSLRQNGFDVFDVKENLLFGSSDSFLLDLAMKQKRVIITLHSDFGTLIHRDKSDFMGVIFFKPGHFEASYHVQTFQDILVANPDIEPPFMLIAEWTKFGTRIRVRNIIR